MELQHLCKTAEGSALVKLIQDRENQRKTTPPPTTHRSRRTYLQNETLNRLITSIPSSITNSFSNKAEVMFERPFSVSGDTHDVGLYQGCLVIPRATCA